MISMILFAARDIIEGIFQRKCDLYRDEIAGLSHVSKWQLVKRNYIAVLIYRNFFQKHNRTLIIIKPKLFKFYPLLVFCKFNIVSYTLHRNFTLKGKWQLTLFPIVQHNSISTTEKKIINSKIYNTFIIILWKEVLIHLHFKAVIIDQILD